MTYVLIAQYCPLLGPILKIRLDPHHLYLYVCIHYGLGLAYEEEYLVYF